MSRSVAYDSIVPRPSLRLSRPALLTLSAVLTAAVCAPPARADDATVLEELRRLRAELEAERRARADERVAFDRRLAAVESSRPAASLTDDEVSGKVEAYLRERDLFDAEPAGSVIPGAGSLLDVSVILDVTFGGSSATDAGLADFNLGDHDPRVRGTNVRNEEVVFSADVDPYFHGVLDVVYKLDEEGESAFELEEAYVVTTSLPHSLQWKAGQFFTEFGRTNPAHPHAWEFLNQPVILGRVFGGDGWRGQGARLSWIAPTECVGLRVLAGFQNARGETQAAFLGEEGEEVGEHVLGRRDVSNLTDLAYHGRIEASRDWPACGACEWSRSVLLGGSFGVGPNSTGPDGLTRVFGADLTVKWSRQASDAGWPFVHWTTEAVHRAYRADDQVRAIDDGLGGTIDTPIAGRTYEDTGFYSQVVWGFCRPLTLGARYDWATSNGAFEGDHRRVSVALSYYPSEFSRIRLQGNYDDVDGLRSRAGGDGDAAVSLWLNFDFVLGKHGEHKF